jgi:hypothetical protein
MPCTVVLTTECTVWLATLTVDERTRVVAYLTLLQEQGTGLRGTYSSAIKGAKHGGMRELRAQIEGRPFRVFYIFDKSRNAVVLTGGDKTGKNQDRWYKGMVRKAGVIYDRYLAEQKSQKR